jgi:2-polyprenyl-6-methoxyphenol hydroxylase-like FAD-dependent oxidoreductase
MLPGATSVLIAGGGPFGLMLALELGRRGIAVVLVDQDAGTAVNPQAHATQARTMEHFRRHGFADEVRSLGLPADFPTDIAYFTRFAKHELARIPLPSSAEAKRMVRSLKGSWSAAELPHRCAQKFIEEVLRRRAEALPGVTIRYSTRLSAFRDAATASRWRWRRPAQARSSASFATISSARTGREAPCGSSSASATAAKPAWCAISWGDACMRSMRAYRSFTGRCRTARRG